MPSDKLKTTTIRIKENYIKEIKHLAIEKQTTQTEIINEYIKKGLLNEGIILNE